MAAATGMSQSTISRIWRAFALAPHRSQTFKLSTDPLFIDKVRDVVGLYLDPPEKAQLACPWGSACRGGCSRSRVGVMVSVWVPLPGSVSRVRHPEG